MTVEALRLAAADNLWGAIMPELMLGCVALLLLAWLFPAPLQEAADVTRVPNPARSAWFLLWMQELISYSAALVYLIAALGAQLIMAGHEPSTLDFAADSTLSVTSIQTS